MFLCQVNVTTGLRADSTVISCSRNVYIRFYFWRWLLNSVCNFDPLQLILAKEYTLAEDKNWHIDHFCCWECDSPLGGQRYVTRDVHPFCILCYEELFARECSTFLLFIFQACKSGGCKATELQPPPSELNFLASGLPIIF